MRKAAGGVAVALVAVVATPLVAEAVERWPGLLPGVFDAGEAAWAAATVWVAQHRLGTPLVGLVGGALLGASLAPPRLGPLVAIPFALLDLLAAMAVHVWVVVGGVLTLTVAFALFGLIAYAVHLGRRLRAIW